MSICVIRKKSSVLYYIKKLLFNTYFLFEKYESKLKTKILIFPFSYDKPIAYKADTNIKNKLFKCLKSDFYSHFKMNTQ